MSATSLDFSFNMEGLDRNALLTEAAGRLNVLNSHLGDDAQKAGDSLWYAKTPSGDFYRNATL